MDERIDEMLEYFGDEVSDTNDHFENYRKNIITVVAYLIGVPVENSQVMIDLILKNITD